MSDNEDMDGSQSSRCVGRMAVVSAHARSLTNFRGPLIRALRDAGVEVHALAPEVTRNDGVRAELESWGVHLHDVPLSRTGLSPLEDVRALFSLRRKLRWIAPDAVFSYNIKPVIYGTLAGSMARVPCRYGLITGLGYAFSENPRGKRLVIQKAALALYRAAGARISTMFFQNPDDRDQFLELGIVNSGERTQLVNGSGVDLEHFSPKPQPGSEIVFLMVARLLGAKGVREFAEAAIRLKHKYPRVRFRLAGDLDDNPDVIAREELESWTENGHVEYLGRISDVRPEMEKATVYVLPSHREGTPRTVLEAMATGRPVITTDAPGCRETVEHGENGFLVPVKDVDALEAAMERFVLDPDLARRMGEKSLQMAVEKYDVHKVNQVMLRRMGVESAEG
ncbi:glycosyltransferase involved in cell wall biosynthesis [Thioalkalivibrio sp. ALE21]|uniref:glycosyltransferase family 4 protein n=1 Tax=Thioalkalivibrio sp. ALE21 TaxID=1158175 RepID=UPI000D87EE91|nr:glycosyltransferase family 4 protein [Thioalkalivibrio sp. ALE21]PYG00003.1 glycosyltransferase involved in cell wall biosynthesis [Thioalkalivibrio sp. ALE21]